MPYAPDRQPSQPRTVEILRRCARDDVSSPAELARMAGIDQTTVSRHLNAKRPVTASQLIDYLRVVRKTRRAPLLAAWLRDTLPPELAESLIAPKGNRVAESVAEYRMTPTDETLDALAWLGDEAATDPQLAKAIRAFCERMGWENS